MKILKAKLIFILMGLACCEMPKALHRDSPFCWSSSIRNSLALSILNPGNTCNTSLVENIFPCRVGVSKFIHPFTIQGKWATAQFQGLEGSNYKFLGFRTRFLVVTVFPYLLNRIVVAETFKGGKLLKEENYSRNMVYSFGNEQVNIFK